MPSGPLDAELVRRLPKVSLHDHLDGSVRAGTLIELAAASGYQELPTTEPADLADWFRRGADRGSLPLYLEGFRHTIALLQDAAALERVAFEYAEDLAQDGVVYAEVRFAPHFHTAGGLGLDAVLDAVLRGLRRGEAEHGLTVRVLVCALRNEPAEQSHRLSELATAWMDRGVCGFDLAGEESG